MQRMGQLLGLKPEEVAEYKRVHRAVWPGVLACITACNIKNYTIFLREPENLLFAYWEYHGSDFKADMAKMAENAETQAWWKICMPMQNPLSTAKEGEWWVMLEDVFHHD